MYILMVIICQVFFCINNNTKWFEGECKYYNFDGSLQYITIFQNDDDTKPKVQHIYIKE
jgi:hypothetical protein